MTESTPRQTELRRLREAQGQSLRAVCAAAQVDPGYWSRVERGIVPPSGRALVRVLDVLGAHEIARELRERDAFFAFLIAKAEERP